MFFVNVHVFEAFEDCPGPERCENARKGIAHTHKEVNFDLLKDPKR